MNSSHPPFAGLNDEQLPGPYCDADKASLAGQRAYLVAIRVDLALVLLAAISGSILIDCEPIRTRAIWLSCIAFGLSIVLSAVLASKRFERAWYAGRAVAESVKSLAWKYSMRAEPFDTADADADDRFIKDLKSIFDERAHLAASLVTAKPSSNQNITPAMRAQRAEPIDVRLRTYLERRVDNQRDWYGTKSANSTQSEGRWFLVIVTSQVLGMLFAFLLVRDPAFPINGTGIFSAVAAAAAAWMQIKRHQELAQSYAVARYELGLIRERGRYIANDQELSVFVSDAETAISREHTLWIARRDA